MEIFSACAGFASAGFHLIAYYVYYKQVKDGSSNPKIVTWLIVTGLMVLNSWSYIRMSEDLVKAMQSIAGVIGSVVLVAVIFHNGNIRLTGREVAKIVFGFGVIILWRLTGSATLANLLVQCIGIYAFWPTIQGVWRNPGNENPIAWYWWNMAFATNAVAVFLRYKQIQDFAYPVIGLCINTSIILLSRPSGKKRLAPDKT